VSVENVEVVRGMLKAWSSGDLDAARASLHPEIKWHDPPQQVGGGHVYRGLAGVGESMRNWVGTWDEWRYEPRELLDAGETVLAVGSQFGRGKGSKVEVSSDLFHLWTVREGKVVEMRMFLDRDEALKAAGLRS
jgi:uncharacterized protein